MNVKFKKIIGLLVVAQMIFPFISSAQKVQALGNESYIGYTDWMYSEAYEAVQNALNYKGQLFINIARERINELNGTDAAWAIGEFSKLADTVQRPILVKAYEEVLKAQQSPTQENINAARDAIDVDLEDVYKNAYSSAVDEVQKKLITKVSEAVEKAKLTKSPEDISNADSLLKEIAKSKSNSIFAWTKQIDDEYSAVVGKISPILASISSVDSIVKFEDEGVELDIRFEINKLEGNIYKSELRGITNITSEYGYTNLKGLENCINLQKLEFWDIGITDLNPLSGLSKLEEIYIDGYTNSISDISALQNVPNLKYLSIGKNNISDLSALNNLKNLDFVYLCDGIISDISSLTNLEHLQVAYLGSNKIKDISAVKGWSNIENLDLSGNQVSDISSLKDLKHLSELNLSYNQLSDINPLKGLKSLASLNLEGNNINDSDKQALKASLPYCEITF